MPRGLRVNKSELYEYFENGFMPKEIEEVTIHSLRTIQTYYSDWTREKLGLPTKIRRTEENIKKANALFEQGLKPKDIYSQLGIGKSTCERYFSEFRKAKKLELLSPSKTSAPKDSIPKSEQNRQNAYALFEQGFSQGEISEKIQMSRSRICNFYKEWVKLKAEGKSVPLPESQLKLEVQDNLKSLPAKQEEKVIIERKEIEKTITEKPKSITVEPEAKIEKKETALNNSQNVTRKNIEGDSTNMETNTNVNFGRNNTYSTNSQPIHYHSRTQTYPPTECHPSVSDLKKGDVVFVFKEAQTVPQTRGVQNFGRPAIVITDDTGRFKGHSVLVALVTKQLKDVKHPANVVITNRALSHTSMILCNQIQTVGKQYLKKVGTLDADELNRLNRALLSSTGIKKIEEFTSSQEVELASNEVKQESLPSQPPLNTSPIASSVPIQPLATTASSPVAVEQAITTEVSSQTEAPIASSGKKLRVKQIELEGDVASYTFSDGHVFITVNGAKISIDKSELASFIDELNDISSYPLK